MAVSTIEQQTVDRVADEYRRQGYAVTIHPRGSDVPDFLAGYEPDVIAIGPSESVIIEIKVGTMTSVFERLRDLAARVEAQPGWRLSLVYVNPDDPDQVTEAQPESLATLQARAASASSLFRAGQTEAAFLLLWSVLEGTLRVLGKRAQLPLGSLPSSALIRELYSAGEISRENFETLMRLLPARNRLAHGLTAPGDEHEIEGLQAVVKSLLGEVAES